MELVLVGATPMGINIGRFYKVVSMEGSRWLALTRGSRWLALRLETGGAACIGIRRRSDRYSARSTTSTGQWSEPNISVWMAADSNSGRRASLTTK